jgi:phage nucleotide-binding protein
MFKIYKPQDEILTTGLTVLIYGEAGIGKTTLANTSNNAILLDFDNGAHRSAFRQDTIRINSWNDIARNFSEFLDAINKYDTIIIDTAGKMLDFMILYLEQENPRLIKAQMQMYGELKKLFQDFHRRIKSLNKDIVFIAHVKEKDEGDFKIKRPLMAGSSYDIVVQSADLVGYMSITNGKTLLDFRASEYIIAKNCGKLDYADVSGLHNIENFMNNLISNTKDSLNKLSKQQQDSIEKCKGIIKHAGSLIDIIEFNKYFELIKNANSDYSKSESLQIWTGIKLIAESRNYTYNATLKTFEQGAE